MHLSLCHRIFYFKHITGNFMVFFCFSVVTYFLQRPLVLIQKCLFQKRFWKKRRNYWTMLEKSHKLKPSQRCFKSKVVHTSQCTHLRIQLIKIPCTGQLLYSCGACRACYVMEGPLPIMSSGATVTQLGSKLT